MFYVPNLTNIFPNFIYNENIHFEGICIFLMNSKLNGIIDNNLL